MVARNLAETLIKGVYAKMHRLLKKHWPGVIQARTGGRWLQQVPQTWPERDEVAVQVGMTTGERMRMMQLLGQVLQQQLQALQAGQDGVLVGLPQLYNTLIDFARAGGLQAPEQYWVDPASEPSQQAAQQKAQAAQQQAMQQAQQAQQVAQQQAALLKELEGIKAQGGVAKAQIDAQRAVAQAEIDARLAMAKTVEDTEVEYAKLRMQLIELNAKYDQEEVPDSMAGEAEEAGEVEESPEVMS
jgi:hypothetical protein